MHLFPPTHTLKYNNISVQGEPLWYKSLYIPCWSIRKYIGMNITVGLYINIYVWHINYFIVRKSKTTIYTYIYNTLQIHIIIGDK